MRARGSNNEPLLISHFTFVCMCLAICVLQDLALEDPHESLQGGFACLQQLTALEISGTALGGLPAFMSVLTRLQHLTIRFGCAAARPIPAAISSAHCVS